MHRVVVGALRSEGRVLLGHRSPTRAWYPDVWDFPGGHIEDGETPSEALVRELREELGIDVTPPASPMTAFTLPDVELDVWVVDQWEGTIENCCPDEHDDLRWVTPAEARTLVLADDFYPELIDQLLA
jgi:mutator protein MutT